ncbi:DUF433 domain-containing protein [Ensifer adhaerens]|uniref:DUF433 domain-containing protein n=1 Tax=Ensifer adhaerens TaxID=106592 RepID=UPI001C4E02D4|nr:DUF433 domain-containing protein [Ensifer adhaerens]MBW0368284.1 DUF433 domain-containing protein [Ensifer adhaerens]UCM24974.1 DUF433 domain-containing protein [Ensifer adhaerens]
MEADITAVAEMLKASEAAMVSRVSLREVNCVIDEHIIPDSFVSLDNGRHVSAVACWMIAFYFDSAKRLTAEERMNTIGEAVKRLRRNPVHDWSVLLGQDWTVRDEFLTIDLGPFVRSVAERVDELDAARAMVTVSDDVLSGTPVIRGTRIPVYDVAASVAAGVPQDRILAAYPGLGEREHRLASIYAEANPARGRPRSMGELAEGARIVTDRRVVRRRKTG